MGLRLGATLSDEEKAQVRVAALRLYDEVKPWIDLGIKPRTNA